MAVPAVATGVVIVVRINTQWIRPLPEARFTAFGAGADLWQTSKWAVSCAWAIVAIQFVLSMHLEARNMAHRTLIRSITILAGLVALWAMAAPSALAVQDAKPSADGAKRTVLVTGANRGLGLEFAKQYHAAGWTVIATAREPNGADDLRAIGKDVRIEALDVADPASVAALAAALKDMPIDLLINNAGISGGGRKLEEINPDEYERVLQVNTIGPMRVTQSLLPNLKAGKGRMIVSISSGLGSIAQNTRGVNYGYRESKAALNMFMRTMAAELKDDGFICIAMSPGWVQTDMGGPNAQLTPEQSITGMRKVMDGLKPEDSGKFWNYTGEIVPW
jgi:NAD(P)-dependent dehydrogenase (short-subunit alcohol dehydrogenase family)